MQDGEPYVYAGIDTSYFATTKYIQSSLGTKDNVNGTAGTVFAPRNVLLWKNVPSAQNQTVEAYLYGKDKFNPDDSLGNLDIDLSKYALDCKPAVLKDATVDSDWFSRNARCSFEVALCKNGKVPRSNNGTAWTPAKAATYTF